MPALDADRMLKASNQQKLDDIEWGVRGMFPIIPKFDQNGKVVGETSPNIEAAWNAANFARVNGQIAAVLEAVKQLAKAQGATINLDAVKQAAKDGTTAALQENLVKVDVTVQGAPSNG